MSSVKKTPKPAIVTIGNFDGVHLGHQKLISQVADRAKSLGMCSLDTAIAELYFNGMVSREDAIAQAAYPDKLERMLVA